MSSDVNSAVVILLLFGVYTEFCQSNCLPRVYRRKEIARLVRLGRDQRKNSNGNCI